MNDNRSCTTSSIYTAQTSSFVVSNSKLLRNVNSYISLFPWSIHCFELITKDKNLMSDSSSFNLHFLFWSSSFKRLIKWSLQKTDRPTLHHNITDYKNSFFDCYSGFYNKKNIYLLREIKCSQMQVICSLRIWPITLLGQQAIVWLGVYGGGKLISKRKTVKLVNSKVTNRI